MQIQKTPLSGVLVIQPKTFSDARGFFYESYQKTRYEEAGIKKPFVQDNISRSTKNTVRGLHYQLERPQAKLVCVLQGTVFDVVVDLRENSPTFGQWFGQLLSDENHLQLYIPEGFAHGFSVLSDTADFLYKCTDYYHPQDERGVLWNDPDLAIDWQIDKSNAVLSPKDLVYPTFKHITRGDLPR